MNRHVAARVRVLTTATAAIVVFGGIVVVVVVDSNHHRRSSTSPTSGKSAETTKLVPTTSTANGLGVRVLLGAFAGSLNQTMAAQTAAVGGLEKTTGVQLGIVHAYRGKLDDSFDTPFIRQYARSPKTVLLSWGGGDDTKKIADGSLDATIRAHALEIKTLGVPILFEYRWEMERPNLASTVHSPADYIAAWDHIRSIFATEHVNNAQFVWCPLARGFVDGTAQKFYPGDSEVDWICSDVYPSGIHPAPSFGSLTAPFLSWAAAHPKPIIFGEFDISTKYSADERSAWLDTIPAVVRAHSRIKALVYFSSAAPKNSTALGSDPKVLASFKALSHL